MRDDLRKVHRQDPEPSQPSQSDVRPPLYIKDEDRGNMVLALEHFDIVLIGESRLREAQHWVSGCECCSEEAAIVFDYLLDGITGCNPTKTQYLLCRPAKCPQCSGEIRENTLVSVV